MRKFYSSHAHVELPSGAISISTDLVNEELLDILTAHHTPITYSSLNKTGLYALHSCIYAEIPMASGDNKYYRVEVGYMKI